MSNYGYLPGGNGPAAPTRQSHDFTLNKGLCDLAPMPKERCTMGEGRPLQIQGFQSNLNALSNKYSDAITELQILKHLEKASDVPLLAGLLIDIAATYLGGLGGAVLKTVLQSSGGGESIISLAESTVKSAGKQAGKEATSTVQNAADAGNKDERDQSKSYLSELKNHVRDDLHLAGKVIPQQVDDIELTRLIEATNPLKFPTAELKRRIESKLGRFMASGVNKIGKSEGKYKPSDFPFVDAKQHTKVIWVNNKVTKTRELWFESQFGAPDRVGEENKEGFKPYDDPRLDKPVPEEFKDAALAEHDEKWGQPPEELDTHPMKGTTRKPGVRPPTAHQNLKSMLFGDD